MANVKLLRQQITDYQRKYGLNQRNYTKSYEKYAADTEAFNTLIQQQYDASAGMNEDTDLDRVGATYYDREAGTNVAAGGTTRPFAAGTYDLPSDGGWGHNTYGGFVPNDTHDEVIGTDEAGEPIIRTVIDNYKVMVGDQVVGITAQKPVTRERKEFSLGGMSGLEYRTPANTIGAYWDDYDKVWRNAPSGGAAPTQRETKAPNLTQKEVGILQGELSPYSYAEIAKQDTSPTSAFADPEDPYNLKDAGVLTRAVAGKI